MSGWSDGTRGPAYAAVPCGRTAPLVRAASTARRSGRGPLRGRSGRVRRGRRTRGVLGAARALCRGPRRRTGVATRWSRPADGTAPGPNRGGARGPQVTTARRPGSPAAENAPLWRGAPTRARAVRGDRRVWKTSASPIRLCCEPQRAPAPAAKSGRTHRPASATVSHKRVPSCCLAPSVKDSFLADSSHFCSCIIICGCFLY